MHKVWIRGAIDIGHVGEVPLICVVDPDTRIHDTLLAAGDGVLA